MFLWPARSWLRKGLEAGFTGLIEILWPKRRIMEVYLNVAEMDEGVFGVEAAARHYWGVGAAELGPQRSARLMAVLPDPQGRSPVSGRPTSPGAARRSRRGRRRCARTGGRTAFSKGCLTQDGRFAFIHGPALVPATQREGRAMLNFDPDRFLAIQTGAVSQAAGIDRVIGDLLRQGAPNVHFLGSGGAAILMQPAVQLLRRRSAFPVFSDNIAELMAGGSVNLKAGSIVIMPSLSGTTKESVAFLDHAARAGATVVALVGQRRNTDRPAARRMPSSTLPRTTRRRRASTSSRCASHFRSCGTGARRRTPRR